jgi:hypothetical protein
MCSKDAAMRSAYRTDFASVSLITRLGHTKATRVEAAKQPKPPSLTQHITANPLGIFRPTTTASIGNRVHKNRLAQKQEKATISLIKLAFPHRHISRKM